MCFVALRTKKGKPSLFFFNKKWEWEQNSVEDFILLVAKLVTQQKPIAFSPISIYMGLLIIECAIY